MVEKRKELNPKQIEIKKVMIILWEKFFQIFNWILQYLYFKGKKLVNLNYKKYISNLKIDLNIGILNTSLKDLLSYEIREKYG